MWNTYDSSIDQKSVHILETQYISMNIYLILDNDGVHNICYIEIIKKACCQNPSALPRVLTMYSYHYLIEIIPLGILVSLGFASGTNKCLGYYLLIVQHTSISSSTNFLNKAIFNNIKIYVFVKSYIISQYSKFLYIFAVFFELWQKIDLINR